MSNMQLKVTDPKHFEQSQEISGRYNDTQKARIAKASKEFEGMLTSMMLKSMDKTTSGMFGSDSFGGDYFGTIFENQMASMISKKKDLGIADILYKKITGEALDSTSSATDLLKLINDSKIEIKKSTGDNSSITPSSKATDRLSKYEGIINEASNSYGVDKNLIKSVILTESAANEKAVSSAKAKGLMQLIDSTASQMGVNNVFDPKENINGGTKYLSEMLRKYNGNLNLALASYNAGPENVQKYGGVPPFEETQNYIKRVIGYFNHLNGEDNGNERSL
jgi:soluble lytic murein transglycosylase-like protein